MDDTTAALSQSDAKSYVLDQVRAGATITEACAVKGICRRSLYEWAAKDDSYREQLNEARRCYAHFWLDDIISLSQTTTAETWQRDRLEIDTKKWALSKVLPKVYGDQPATLVQNNVLNVVCDEATRASLIEQRERLLSGRATKDAPQGNVERSSGILEGELVS